VTENDEEVEQDFPGKGSIYEDGRLDGQMFIDTSPSFQRLTNDVARLFYAEGIPNDFARVLQCLKNCFGFDKI
jgi:hypothetical protein